MPEAPSPVRLFGIPNCDRVRAARKWLDAARVAYQFHDLRRDGVGADRLARWFSSNAWDVVVNTRGTTWRQTPAAARAHDTSSAMAAAREEPTLIRRPVLEVAGTVIFGFSEIVYVELFSSVPRDSNP